MSLESTLVKLGRAVITIAAEKYRGLNEEDTSVPALPEIPSLSSAAVAQARAQMRFRLRYQRGRQSTIATGPMGLLFTPPEIIKRKSLLGEYSASSS